MCTTNDLKYEQLSEDWRHRDQLTWQLPSIIMAVSVTLIAAVFQFGDKLGDMRFPLLWAGSFFTGLLSLSLGQNLYYQTVGEDLINEIDNGSQVKASRLPKRRANGPSFKKIIIRNCLRKTGSSLLFLLCGALTGFIGYVLIELHFPGQSLLLWVIVIALGIVVLTTLINGLVYTFHKQ